MQLFVEYHLPPRSRICHPFIVSGRYNVNSCKMDDSSFSESETCSEGEDDNILGGVSKEQRVRFILLSRVCGTF